MTEHKKSGIKVYRNGEYGLLVTSTPCIEEAEEIELSELPRYVRLKIEGRGSIGEPSVKMFLFDELEDSQKEEKRSNKNIFTRLLDLLRDAFKQ